MSYVKIGVGGPVGSGKTALIERLTRIMSKEYSICVITNDIYTKEDAEFLIKNSALPPERIVGVETGGCPHTAIREDCSMNLEAVDEMAEKFPDVQIIFIESGGDNQKVLEYGRTFLMIVTPFHAIVAVKIITDAVLKGAGYMQGFMISTFVDLILRVIFSYIFASFGGFTGLCWAYPLGWVIGTVFSIVFYAMGKWKQVRLI